MHSTRALITAPTAAVMSLAGCKASLGITGTDQDAILTAALNAVVGQLDPASGGWLGRALRPQTWELRLSSFWNHDCHHYRYDRSAIALPFPKLISVDSIKYDDCAGVEQTLIKDTDFRVLGVGSLGKQAVAPLYNRYWPISRFDHESVRIQFTSGYAPAVPADPGPASPDEMPAAITEAISLGVRMLLSNGGANLYLSLDSVPGVSEKRYIVSTAANELLTTAMQSMLSTYRAY